MDDWWVGHRRLRQQAQVGDLVVCVDVAKKDTLGLKRRFIGLVLDKSITIYRIQVVGSGEQLYWPATATYLWKETE